MYLLYVDSRFICMYVCLYAQWITSVSLNTVFMLSTYVRIYTYIQQIYAWTGSCTITVDVFWSLVSV